MAKGKYIPNSFQTPNEFADELCPLLTPQEFVVLVQMTRAILGWQDKIDKLRSRVRLCYLEERSGLCRSAVLVALGSLERANIVRECAPGQGSRGGAEFELNLGQLGEYDWDWLEIRNADRDAAARARTARARQALAQGQETVEKPPESGDNIGDNSPEIGDNSVESGDNPAQVYTISGPTEADKGLSDRPLEVCPTGGLDGPILHVNPTIKPNQTGASPPIMHKPAEEEKTSPAAAHSGVRRIAEDYCRQWGDDKPDVFGRAVERVFQKSGRDEPAFVALLYEEVRNAKSMGLRARSKSAVLLANIRKRCGLQMVNGQLVPLPPDPPPRPRR